MHAQAVDHLRGGVAQGDLLGREADVHQSAVAAANVGAHSSLQRPPQHLARRRPRDRVDEDHVVHALVGGQRVGRRGAAAPPP